jgi:3-phenylpropionate/trans-cinnamate dioxygenase ferredoxin subunit
MSEWHNVKACNELPVGEHHVIAINGHPIAVFNLEGEYYAIEDCCTHQSLPLSDGYVDGDEITCPFHGAKFNIKSGEVTAPPAFEDLTTFEVRVQDGMIQVKV